jgi:hypothetical protein
MLGTVFYRFTIVLVVLTYAAMVYADYSTAGGEWECHDHCEQ